MTDSSAEKIEQKKREKKPYSCKYFYSLVENEQNSINGESMMGLELGDSESSVEETFLIVTGAGWCSMVPSLFL